jgi:hypothetical protein
MMNGRGMYFNAETGQLFEGWFHDNEFMAGRCIKELCYYVASKTRIEYLDNGTRNQGNLKSYQVNLERKEKKRESLNNA